MEIHWIVVAESARARIFETASRAKPPTEIMSLAHPASRLKEGELVEDRPGRAHGSGNRHGVGNGDAHTHEVEIFAREVAAKLEQGRQEGRYGKLVLVAAPAFLGVLRHALTDQVEKKVSASLDKHLVDASPEDIRQHVFA